MQFDENLDGLFMVFRKKVRKDGSRLGNLLIHIRLSDNNNNNKHLEEALSEHKNFIDFFSSQNCLTCELNSNSNCVSIRSITCQILSPNHWFTSRGSNTFPSTERKSKGKFLENFFSSLVRGRTFRSGKFFNSALSMGKSFSVSRCSVNCVEGTTRAPTDHVLLPCARIVQQNHVMLKASTPLCDAFAVLILRLPSQKWFRVINSVAEAFVVNNFVMTCSLLCAKLFRQQMCITSILSLAWRPWVVFMNNKISHSCCFSHVNYFPSRP